MEPVAFSLIVAGFICKALWNHAQEIKKASLTEETSADPGTMANVIRLRRERETALALRSLIILLVINGTRAVKDYQKTAAVIGALIDKAKDEARRNREASVPQFTVAPQPEVAAKSANVPVFVARPVRRAVAPKAVAPALDAPAFRAPALNGPAFQVPDPSDYSVEVTPVRTAHAPAPARREVVAAAARTAALAAAVTAVPLPRPRAVPALEAPAAPFMTASSIAVAPARRLANLGKTGGIMSGEIAPANRGAVAAQKTAGAPAVNGAASRPKPASGGAGTSSRGGAVAPAGGGAVGNSGESHSAAVANGQAIASTIAALEGPLTVVDRQVQSAQSICGLQIDAMYNQGITGSVAANYVNVLMQIGIAVGTFKVAAQQLSQAHSMAVQALAHHRRTGDPVKHSVAAAGQGNVARNTSHYQD
ncbi:hypothetical protein [Microbispora sp. NPDC049125]|uniref:hypothetical protein n=1 Tax=Microbispora sp. NPDC049125 TaxID=3154929 RepID=UPI00346701CD